MPRLKHPEIPRLLARNVWRYREQRRMTASDLAEKLDWPLVELYQIEGGDKTDLSLDELERLSLGFTLSLPIFSEEIRLTKALAAIG